MLSEQDVATSRNTLTNRARLQEKFSGRVISRLSDAECCYLALLNFFLWGMWNIVFTS